MIRKCRAKGGAAACTNPNCPEKRSQPTQPNRKSLESGEAHNLRNFFGSDRANSWLSESILQIDYHTAEIKTDARWTSNNHPMTVDMQGWINLGDDQYPVYLEYDGGRWHGTPTQPEQVTPRPGETQQQAETRTIERYLKDETRTTDQQTRDITKTQTILDTHPDAILIRIREGSSPTGMHGIIDTHRYHEIQWRHPAGQNPAVLTAAYNNLAEKLDTIAQNIAQDPEVINHMRRQRKQMRIQQQRQDDLENDYYTWLETQKNKP